MAAAKIDFSPVYSDIERHFSDTAELLERELKINCPVDTGYMYSTISSTSDDNSCSVFVGADYASYTEYQSGWITKTIQGVYKEVGDLWSLKG